MRLSQEWQASTTQRRARQPGRGAFQFELVAAATDVRRVAAADARARRPTGRRSRRRGTGPADARRTARAARSASSRVSGLGALSRGGWRRHAPARSGPLPPRREANVSPPFCSISRIRAGRLATKRRLPGRPVARQPGPVDPDLLVVVEQPLPPDLVEDTGLLPLLEAPVRRRRANRSRSRSTRSTASRCAARAGSRPSRPGRTRAACDSPTDAPAAAATTARPAPTTSPASAIRRRSRPDPSKPPSSISATRSDFAIHRPGPCLPG